MRLVYFLFALFTLISVSLCRADDPEGLPEERSVFNTARSIYAALGDDRLSFEAFLYAYEGYCKILNEGVIKKTNILTLIDFDKTGNDERFFIIDLQNLSVLFQTLVAHGRNSGDLMATSFSNIANSYKSSLGFYLTGETYMGQHGLSLRLDGLEQGINDNARARSIVIHSADYVSKKYIERNGRLGRSFGCPSLPAENYFEIINTIKEKTILFIYSGQSDYLNKSKYL